MAFQRVAIASAVHKLRAGGLAVFPTETLWSLSCRPDREAVDGLRDAKGRPADVPLALGFATWQASWPFVEWPKAARALATKLLPGPLTLVLDATDDDFAHLAPGRGTLAVRVPSHPTAQEVLRLAGPTVMTSANPHGRPDLQTADDIERALAGIDAVLVTDGAADVKGTASTIVDARGDRPIVLREGVITQAEVAAAWPS